MGLPLDQAKKIVAEFKKDYFFREPFDQYLGGCGISTLGVMQNKYGMQLRAGDETSLDDLCISVRLEVELPEGLNLPEEYLGLRVFYQRRADFVFY